MDFYARSAHFPKRMRQMLVLLAAAWLLFGCSSDIDVGEHLQNAIDYEAKGEYQAAAIELRNVVREDPDNAAARLLFGKVNLHVGFGRGAIKELERAIELGAPQGEAGPALVRAYLLDNDYKAAGKLLDAADDSWDAAELATMRGYLHLSKAQYTDALKLFEAAREVDPDNPLALRGLARLALLLKNYSLAAEHLANATQLAPDSIPGWIDLGTLQAVRGDYQASLASYEKALSLSRDVPGVHLGMARALLGLKQTDQADEHLAWLKKKFNKSPVVWHLFAVSAYQHGDMLAAQNRVREGLSLAPDHLLSLLFAGSLHYETGELEQAANSLRRVLIQSPRHKGAAKMLGMVYLKNGQYEDAVSLLKRFVDDKTDDEALLTILGRAYVGAGDGVAGLAMFERATKVAPDSESAKAHKAIGLLSSGHTDEAIEELGKMRAANAQLTSSDMLLVQTLVSLQRYEQAAQVAASLIDKQPDSPVPYVLLARVYELSGEPEKSRAQQLAALKVQPGYLDALLGLASLANAQQKPAEAREWFEKILADDPAQADALLGIVALDLADGDAEKAVALMHEAADKNPAYYRPVMALARYYASNGEYQKALGFAEQAAELAPRNREVLNTLGHVQLELDLPQKALSTIQKLNIHYPAFREGYLMLAKVQEMLGELKAARASLDKALSIEKNDLRGLLIQGNQTLSRGKADEALQVALRIQEEYPQSSDVYVLLNRIYSLRQDWDKALAVADELARRQPGSALPLVLKGRAYQVQEEFNDAEGYYRKALQVDADNVEAYLALASLYVARKDIERARSLYQKVLELDFKDDRALIALASLQSNEGGGSKTLELLKQAVRENPGQLTPVLLLTNEYLQRGWADEAMEAARSALKLAPDNPKVLLAYSQARLLNGQLEDALAAATKLVAMAPESPHSHYQMGVVYNRLKRTDDFVKSFEKVVALDPGNLVALMSLAQVEADRGHRDKALAYIRKVKEAKADAEINHGSVGDVLMLTGDIDGAIAEYRKKLVRDPSARAVLRLSNALQKKADEVAATQVLSDWLAGHPQDSLVLEARANAYLFAGDLELAETDYLKLLNLDQDNVVALNNLADLKARAGDLQTAQSYAERANKLNGEDPNIMDTYGWLLVQNGAAQQGLKLLRQAVDALPDNGSVRYHMVSAYVKAGDTARAKTELEKLLQSTLDFPERDKAQRLMKRL